MFRRGCHGLCCALPLALLACGDDGPSADAAAQPALEASILGGWTVTVAESNCVDPPIVLDFGLGLYEGAPIVGTDNLTLDAAGALGSTVHLFLGPSSAQMHLALSDDGTNARAIVSGIVEGCAFEDLGLPAVRERL